MFTKKNEDIKFFLNKKNATFTTNKGDPAYQCESCNKQWWLEEIEMHFPPPSMPKCMVCKGKLGALKT